MLCKICGLKLSSGFEQLCPAPFKAPSGKMPTHYSLIDRGDQRHGFRMKEAFVLHDFLLVNVVGLNEDQYMVVFDQNAPPSNGGELFKIYTNILVDDLKNLSKQDLKDKLNLFQIFS